MKRFLQKFAIVVALFAVVSCESDDSSKPGGNLEIKNGFYLLNSGGFGDNNASLDYYDYEKNTLTSNVFEAQNGKKMGDLLKIC